MYITDKDYEHKIEKFKSRREEKYLHLDYIDINEIFTHIL